MGRSRSVCVAFTPCSTQSRRLNKLLRRRVFASWQLINTPQPHQSKLNQPFPGFELIVISKMDWDNISAKNSWIRGTKMSYLTSNPLEFRVLQRIISRAG